MTCKEMMDFLDRYVAEELPPENRARFEEHLDRCPPCVNYLDSYRKTIRLGRDAMLDEATQATEKMPDELVEAILATVGKKSP